MFADTDETSTRISVSQHFDSEHGIGEDDTKQSMTTYNDMQKQNKAQMVALTSQLLRNIESGRM